MCACVCVSCPFVLSLSGLELDAKCGVFRGPEERETGGVRGWGRRERASLAVFREGGGRSGLPVDECCVATLSSFERIAKNIDDLELSLKATSLRFPDEFCVWYQRVGVLTYVRRRGASAE